VERSKGRRRGSDQSVAGESFLHYAFDEWMRRNHPNIPLNGMRIYYCPLQEREASSVDEEALEKRLSQCRLELHPDKTEGGLLQG